MLYDSENIFEDRKEKFEWIADLTHSICDLYKGASGINAPFLWLGTVNAIDVRLKAGLHWGQARLSQVKLSVGKCLHLQ